jgi:Xaa-Pro aminopeptidase
MSMTLTHNDGPGHGDPHDRPYNARVDSLRAALTTDGIDGLLVFDPVNIRYLTGFTGSAGVAFVTHSECVLLSDFRYRVQGREQAPEAHFVELNGAFSAALPDLLQSFQGVLGVERDSLKVADWEKLQAALGDTEHRLAGGHVRSMRRVKSPQELNAIAEASKLAVQTMLRLHHIQVVGRTEREVAIDLEFWARSNGSEGVPFPFIVAWGPESAKPHAEAGYTVIGEGGLLVVDLGATVDGYASDMTRTFQTGRIGNEERRAFDVTLRAQKEARSFAGPGLACSTVDQVARDLISAEGYGENFKHGLGHGVGLEVHEEPSLSTKSEDTLTPGMVVTIEPGIYIEGLGGVRIEDSVAVTESGVDVLTELERDLLLLS